MGLEGTRARHRQCQHSRSTPAAEPNPGRAARRHVGVGGARCRRPESAWAADTQAGLTRSPVLVTGVSLAARSHCTHELCAVRGEERGGDSALGRHAGVRTRVPRSRPVAACIARAAPRPPRSFPRTRLPGLRLRGGRAVVHGGAAENARGSRAARRALGPAARRLVSAPRRCRDWHAYCRLPPTRGRAPGSGRASCRPSVPTARRSGPSVGRSFAGPSPCIICGPCGCGSQF